MREVVELHGEKLLINAVLFFRLAASMVSSLWWHPVLL